MEPTTHHHIWNLVADVQYEEAVDSYRVNGIDVKIFPGRMEITEPPLDDSMRKTFSTVMDHMSRTNKAIAESDNLTEQDLILAFKNSAKMTSQSKEIEENFATYQYYLVRDMMGHGVLDVLWNDADIEDLAIQGLDTPVCLIHRRHQEMNYISTNIVFRDAATLDNYIAKICDSADKTSTYAEPHVEGSTPEGHRISAISGSDICPRGTTISIRKFMPGITITRLLDGGMLPYELAALIWIILDANGTGMIFGNTGSGKTTTLNALLNLLDNSSVIITIEDSPELQIVQPQWISLRTRKSINSLDQRNDFGYSRLMKISLRHRPTCIVVGESRDEEVQTAFQVFATGHTALSTFHASSSEKLIHRLQSKPNNIHEAQFDDMWFLLHVGRLISGKKIYRRVMEYSEMQLEKDGKQYKIKPVDIIKYDPITQKFQGAEIDNIIEKSQKIRDAAKWNGIDDIKKEMARRVAYLKECVANQIFDDKEIVEKLSRYVTE